VSGKAARVRKRALVAQDIDEDAVAALGMEAVDRLREDARIIDSWARNAVGRRGDIRNHDLGHYASLSV